MKSITFTVINDLTYDQRMHKICSTLTQAGYQVELIGRKLKSSLPLSKEVYKQTRVRCFINKGKLFYTEYNIRLLFLLLFKKADIYGAIDLDTILPNLLVSRIRKKQVVYDAHEYFSELPEVIDRKRVKRFWEFVGKYAIPKMHRCYTVNESLSEIFSQKYGKVFSIIQNVPLLESEIKNTDKPKKDIIIYQGWINKGRGLETLIEAMHEINAELIIVGEGDISAQIKELVDNHHLNSKVRFTGFLLPNELKKLTATAKIGYNVLESQSKNYYYSLSNKFFSYIHAGIPSISSDFPEYRKFNDKFEVCMLTDLDAEKIGRCINKLLTDEDLYKKLSDNCLKAREIYSWQEEEKKLVDLYNGL